MPLLGNSEIQLPNFPFLITVHRSAFCTHCFPSVNGENETKPKQNAELSFKNFYASRGCRHFVVRSRPHNGTMAKYRNLYRICFLQYRNFTGSFQRNIKRNYLEFDAKASNGCLHLQVDWTCLCHTLAFRNLFCGVHMVPKLYFGPYLVIWWHWPLTLKFSEMLNTPLISLFHKQKSPPGTLEWSYGSKTVILPAL